MCLRTERRRAVTMRGRHWTIVGVTTALLLAEVVIAQLCKSPITLLDGFHTLHMLLTALLVTQRPFSLDPREPLSHCPPPVTQIRGVNCMAMRAQPVGMFISRLVLLSLNIVYLTEICSFMLEPASTQRPLLLVATGAVSLVLKTALLGLQWHKEQSTVRSGLAAESHIEVNLNALSGEEKAQTGQDAVFNNNEPTGLNLDGSLLNTALTMRCSNISSSEELHANDDQTETDARPVRHRQESAWTYIAETLITPFLVLVIGLVTLSPLCLYSSKLCRSLAYLDPILSLMTVLLLITRTIPPVFRNGLLLLQGAPTHFSVDEVRKRIMNVPGVESMHEFHVWKLTESIIVASVHVHCDATVQSRYLDVIVGVTRVLQSVGVHCCTVQPEFTDVDPSLQLCSLACAEACVGSMCCSHLAKQHKIVRNGTTQEESTDPEPVTTVHA